MALKGYSAYGLRIHTDLECPELRALPVEMEHPDVTIHLLPPSTEDWETLGTGGYEVQPRVFRMLVPDVAQYTVEDGRRILITPFPNAAAEELRLFLLGSAMGALLYQRGLFPLHGSAVETPWGAMIFVGVQGAGKSTLAAEFHRKGYRLLSDDVCAVEATPEGLRILPALVQFRLCADAYDRLGANRGGGARFNVDKFVVPMGEGYCPDPAPLRAIHILSDHESSTPEFEVLHGFDRVQRLLENLYRPHFLKGQDTQGDLMRMAGLIAKKATMVALTRRRDPEAVDGLVTFLELAWAERFAANP